MSNLRKRLADMNKKSNKVIKSEENYYTVSDVSYMLGDEPVFEIYTNNKKYSGKDETDITPGSKDCKIIAKAIYDFSLRNYKVDREFLDNEISYLITEGSGIIQISDEEIDDLDHMSLVDKIQKYGKAVETQPVNRISHDHN